MESSSRFGNGSDDAIVNILVLSQHPYLINGSSSTLRKSLVARRQSSHRDSASLLAEKNVSAPTMKAHDCTGELANSTYEETALSPSGC